MASRKKHPIPGDALSGGRQPLRTLSQNRGREPLGLAHCNSGKEPLGLAHAHSNREPAGLVHSLSHSHSHSQSHPHSLTHSHSQSHSHPHSLTHSHSLSEHPSGSFTQPHGQQRPPRSVSHSHWDASQGGGPRGLSLTEYPGNTPPMGPPPPHWRGDRPPRRSVSYTQAQQQGPRGVSSLNPISRSESIGGGTGVSHRGVGGGGSGGHTGPSGGGLPQASQGGGRPPKRGHGTMSSLQNGIMRRIDAVGRRLALRKAAARAGAPQSQSQVQSQAQSHSQSQGQGQGQGHVEAQECDTGPVSDAGVPLGEWASGSFAHHPPLPRVMRTCAPPHLGATVDFRGAGGEGEAGGDPVVHLLIRVCERALGPLGAVQPGWARDSDACMQGVQEAKQGQGQGASGGIDQRDGVEASSPAFGREGWQGAWVRLVQAAAEEGWPWEEVEHVAWGCFRDFLRLARAWPQALRAALRVLEVLEERERQERQGGVSFAAGTPGASPDDSLSGAGAGAGAASRCQLKCYTQLVQGVDDRFRHLLETEVHGENVVEILDKASALSSDLLEICQHVAPAFPPAYQVFPFLLQQYARKFVEVSRQLGARAPRLSSRDILRVLRWGSWLKGRIISLSGDARLAHVPSELAALDPLVEEYIGRMGSFLRGCLANLLEIERAKLEGTSETEGGGGVPYSGPDGGGGGGDRGGVSVSMECLRGPFPSSLPVDAFSLLLGELEEARMSGNSLVLRKLTVTVQEVLVSFQQMLGQECGARRSPRGLLALANASIRCIELAVELGNDASKLVGARYAAHLRFPEVAEGFRGVAAAGAQRAVKCSFQKACLRGLAAEVAGEEWAGEGEAAARLAEASEAVLGFWEEGLLQEAFQLAARALLERLTLLYIERLVGRRRPFSPSDVQGLARAMGLLTDIFTRYIGREAVRDRVQIFDSLCVIASAEGGDEVVHGYAAMIGSTWPECSPRLVERLVSLRTDVCKEDAMDIVEMCRMAWNEHQARHHAQQQAHDELAL